MELTPNPSVPPPPSVLEYSRCIEEEEEEGPEYGVPPPSAGIATPYGGKEGVLPSGNGLNTPSEHGYARVYEPVVAQLVQAQPVTVVLGSEYVSVDPSQQHPPRYEDDDERSQYSHYTDYQYPSSVVPSAPPAPPPSYEESI